MRLKDKVAIVTGGAHGMGEVEARLFAGEGAKVVVADLLEREGEAVAAELCATQHKALFVHTDVTSERDWQRLIAETIAAYGRLDILVNNAGIMFTKPVSATTETEFDRIFAINVKGTFFACQQAATRMSDGGRIINLSSSTTARFMPTYGAYVATKGAVEQLTRAMAKELGPRGITINAVSPGPTETELFLSGKTPEQLQQFGQLSAFGRLGRPAEIGEVVAFLASDAAGWITGQNIRVNGGLA